MYGRTVGRLGSAQRHYHTGFSLPLWILTLDLLQAIIGYHAAFSQNNREQFNPIMLGEHHSKQDLGLHHLHDTTLCWPTETCFFCGPSPGQIS